MLRYAITDAARTASSPEGRHDALHACIRRWAAEGIDFIQLREKSLPAGELFSLAQTLREDLLQSGSSIRLLLNARADLAVAAGAHGVHLTSSPGELTAKQVRSLFAQAGRPAPFLSASCHTVEQAAHARGAGVDLILFGPVFEKVAGGAFAAEGVGLTLLREAVQGAHPVPVLALGGVTYANAPACLSAGAAGIAGIRLFA